MPTRPLDRLKMPEIPLFIAYFKFTTDLPLFTHYSKCSFCSNLKKRFAFEPAATQLYKIAADA